MQIQSNLGSTIAMAFDECPPSRADYDYIKNSVDRTTRWLARCKEEMARLNVLPDPVNREQLLFGINQGGVIDEIRIRSSGSISHIPRIKSHRLVSLSFPYRPVCIPARTISLCFCASRRASFSASSNGSERSRPRAYGMMQ